MNPCIYYIFVGKLGLYWELGPDGSAQNPTRGEGVLLKPTRPISTTFVLFSFGKSKDIKKLFFCLFSSTTQKHKKKLMSRLMSSADSREKYQKHCTKLMKNPSWQKYNPHCIGT